MKYIFMVILTVVIVIYALLFTTFGNYALRPFVESKINKELGLSGHLSLFNLRLNSFDLLYEVDKNSIKLDGNYSIFAKSIDASYDLALANLSSFEQLANMPLVGEASINGKAFGTLALMDVEGLLKLQSSPISFSIKLDELKPISMKINTKEFKLEDLLYTLAKNPYAKALVDIDANIKNISDDFVDANIELSTKNALLSSLYMKKDFDVDMLDTPFSLNIEATTKDKKATYALDLNSNSFYIKSSGKLESKPLKIDAKYDLNIADLQTLKPFIAQNLRGDFKTNGVVFGGEDDLKIEGETSAASSKSTYSALLKNSKLSTILLNVSNLDIAKLTYMLDLPPYATGRVGVEAKLDGFENSINGNIIGVAQNVVLNSMVIKKEFELDLPKTSLEARAVVDVSDGVAKSNSMRVDSNLANVALKDFTYNLNDASLSSNYILDVKELSNLEPLLGRKIRGAFLGSGNISKAKDLELNLDSKSIGDLSANLKNDDLVLKIKKAKAQQLLHMFYYPEVLDADVDVSLDYSLLSKKGLANLVLSDGFFKQNQPFDLVKQYTKTDLYKESFGGTSKANIDGSKIAAVFDLKSNSSSIVSPKTHIDSNKIDSNITLAHKKDSINVNLSGDINSPKVSIDFDAFLKSEAGQKAIKKVDKFLDKLFKR